MRVVKVVSIVGARPQFVKASVVSRALRTRDCVREVLVHTGQHYDENLSEVFFEELGVPEPDHHLGIGSGTHGAQTGRMLEAIERILLKEHPAVTLVYGDTNSTLAGALASVKLGIPVVHVEAGLRMNDPFMPEEINRVATDHVSALLFAPTDEAVRNLRREGIPEARIRQVGDVMYDVALHFAGRAAERSTVLRRLGLSRKGYVLATVHRAATTDDPAALAAVFGGLSDVGAEIPVVVPLHPRTRAALSSAGLLDRLSGGLRVVDPVGYLDMVELERNARLIATDSGGVQKEAFFHRVPCVTLMETTPWVELVEAGWNRTVPARDAAEVASALREGLGRPAGMECAPYGRGDTAVRIADALVAEFLRGAA